LGVLAAAGFVDDVAMKMIPRFLVKYFSFVTASPLVFDGKQLENAPQQLYAGGGRRVQQNV
jgi:hypothetical protein